MREVRVVYRGECVVLASQHTHETCAIQAHRTVTGAGGGGQCWRVCGANRRTRTAFGLFKLQFICAKLHKTVLSSPPHPHPPPAGRNHLRANGECRGSPVEQRSDVESHSQIVRVRVYAHYINYLPGSYELDVADNI